MKKLFAILVLGLIFSGSIFAKETNWGVFNVADKKGGGRQPQSRKLNRRKYLEYKYAARELLDDESISEEHRSNVLGQIWAKGERIGVEAAVEFIDQKEEELVITSEVATEFRKMVKKYTTRR